MHPIPLFGAAEDQPLQRGVISARVAADFFACAIAFDGGQRFFEAKHMVPIGLAPARRGEDRGTRGKRDDGKALECPRRVAEEVDLDAVWRSGMLIEWKDNRVTRSESLENRVERASLRQHAET